MTLYVRAMRGLLGCVRLYDRPRPSGSPRPVSTSLAGRRTLGAENRRDPGSLAMPPFKETIMVRCFAAVLALVLAVSGCATMPPRPADLTQLSVSDAATLIHARKLTSVE